MVVTVVRPARQPDASSVGFEDARRRLRYAIERLPPQLRLRSDEVARHRPAPERWTLKELVGHLVDSAVNNHRRFVCGQVQNFTKFPPYAHADWVQIQCFNEMPWPELIGLWRSMNVSIAHVWDVMPPEKSDYRCRVGDGERTTLAGLAVAYVDHLEGHLVKSFGSWGPCPLGSAEGR
ncbi:MAG: DinB family protein [Planctomycetota bacterium]